MVAFPRGISFSLHGSYPTIPTFSKPKESWQENELEKTNLFSENGSYWITLKGIGAVNFAQDTFEIHTYPDKDIPQNWFQGFINNQWVPRIYQLWGFQVIHASAVLHKPTGNIIAFSGPSHSGKSTIAFGLGRRDNWMQIADNTLGFQTSNGRIELVSIQNEIRLRRESAEYFGEELNSCEILPWHEDIKKELKEIYFLEKLDKGERVSKIEEISVKQAYPLMLKQSYILTSSEKEMNKKVYTDYLTLTSSVDTYKLSYNTGFDNFDNTLNFLEEHSLN